MVASSFDLRKRIARTIREQRLFEPGDTLIVALSGGADSTALLDLLANQPDFSPRLVVAHLNHCLRGHDSDTDEEFTRNLAARYGIPFESRRVDIADIAAQQRLNLEDAGRRARFAFFEELRQKWRAAAIAVAHHSDDQAETVLMRLLRGSGPGGLRGMPYRNNRNVIRPLLNISRAEIEAYLAELGLTWREDASNQDAKFLRNRIRHELLPLLEQYNPAIREHLNTTGALIAEEDQMLNSLAENFAARARASDNDAIVCDIKELALEPSPLRKRVLRLMFKRLAGNLDHLANRHVSALERLVDSNRPNAALNLPQGIRAVREYDALRLQRITDSIPISYSQLIQGPGSYPTPWGDLLTVSMESGSPDFGSLSHNIVFIDLDKAPFPWSVRNFRNGDRMVPLGMTGAKKVKEIFIEAKIPLSRRSRIPLVFSNDTLIWVCGLRGSQLARIDGATSRIVSMTISRA